LHDTRKAQQLETQRQPAMGRHICIGIEHGAIVVHGKRNDSAVAGLD
jgi:hypothetical protein